MTNIIITLIKNNKMLVTGFVYHALATLFLTVMTLYSYTVYDNWFYLFGLIVMLDHLVTCSDLGNKITDEYALLNDTIDEMLFIENLKGFGKTVKGKK